MDAITAIETRRSWKRYDAGHRMSDEETARLLDLAMLAPTAFNIQHWRFVVAKDPGLRAQIREVAWNQAQVTDASLLLVLCADLAAWRRSPERYWRNAPEPVRDALVPAIAAYYEGDDRVQRDEAMRSCGIAAGTIMIAATAMGYQTCPMDGFDFDAVGRLLNLPDDHCIAMMIAIGKGTEAPWPRPGPLGRDEVVVEDRF